MSFQGIFGYVSKVDFIKYLYAKFNHHFSKEEWDPTNIFNQVYGINGAYFSDLDEDINFSPLVLIQSHDLAKLVAIKKLAEQLIEDNDFNEENIASKTYEIKKSYMLAKGMTEEDIKFWEEFSK